MDKSVFIKMSILKNKNNWLTILILTILLIIFFYLFNFSSMILNYLSDNKTKNISNRTLLVSDNDSNLDILKLENMSNVTQVNSLNYGQIVISSKEYETIYLRALSNKEISKLKIKKGQKELGNGNIVCPVDFIPIDDFYGNKENISKKVIDTNEKIGSSFTGTFSQYSYDEFLNKNIVETKEKEFHIIGNYNNKEYMTENNVCFATLDDVKEIVDFITEDYKDNIHKIYSVVVDNVNNLDDVKINIEKLGYTVKYKIETNNVAIVFLSTIAMFIFLAIIFIIGLSINSNIKRDISNKEKEILLYKSIGYTKKDIVHIYQIEYLLVFICAILFAIIISCLSFSLLTSYLTSYSVFNILSLEIVPTSIYFMVFIGLIFSEIIIRNRIKKILKTSQIKL